MALHGTITPGSTASQSNPFSTSTPTTFIFSSVGTGGVATVTQTNFWIPSVTTGSHSITSRNSLSWGTTSSIYTGLALCSAPVGGFGNHYMVLSYLFLTFDNSIFS